MGLGRYGEQVQHLYEHFPREQVLLLRYKELKDTPAATLDRVCYFLGVRTGLLTSVPRENVNRHVVEDNGFNKVLRFLLRSGGDFGHRVPVPLRLAARGPLLTVLHRKTGARPVTTPEERAALLPYFADDIALLTKVTGESYDDRLSVDRHAAPGTKHWRVELLEADTPEGLATAVPRVVLAGDGTVAVKDPVLHHDAYGWHLWASVHPLESWDDADRMTTRYATSPDGVQWTWRGTAPAAGVGLI